MKDFDVHRANQRLEAAQKAILRSIIPEQNKSLIFEFRDYCLSTGLSKLRIVKYMTFLLRLSKWLKVSFEDASKKDLSQLVLHIEKQDYSEWTKRDYKMILKRFYKWLNGDDEYPDKVKWINTSFKKKNRKLPEDLLSVKEVEQIIDTANHPREKAMVALLYESGCRIGELLNMKLKHVVFDDYGAKIIINESKTVSRSLRIIASVPHLATWIENHPLKDKPDAPLWVTRNVRNSYDPIQYKTVRALIQRLGEEAALQKRVHPHLFRHSRATHLANHFTEAQMNNYFGWVQGSNMPSTYVHLSGRDMESAVLKLHGFKMDKKEKTDEFTPKKCHRCEKMNPPTGKFCLRCGAALDIDTAMKVEEKRQKMDNIMTILLKDLLKDPTIQARIENKLEQIKVESHPN